MRNALCLALHLLAAKTSLSTLCLSLIFSCLSSSCLPGHSIDQTSSLLQSKVAQGVSIKTAAKNQKSQKLRFKIKTGGLSGLPFQQNSKRSADNTDQYKLHSTVLHFLILFLSTTLSIQLYFSPFCNTFSPFCREGHKASGDPVPQEESKRPPPSLCFFITYYLCLTDLLHTNGCHMEKESKAEENEEKNSLHPFSLAY